MLVPQSYSVVQGESLRIAITVLDSAGAAVDLSGSTSGFGISRRAGEALVASTEVSPPTVTTSFNSPPTDGVVNVEVASTVTDDMLGTYDWECRVIDSYANETVVARGYLTVSKRVIP